MDPNVSEPFLLTIFYISSIAAEHLAIEQDLIEMQDAESEFDRNGSGVGTEIDVDETIKSEPNHSANGDSSKDCEIEEIGTKSPTQADYLQTKNGLVRASILPAATTSQVSVDTAKLDDR